MKTKLLLLLFLVFGGLQPIYSQSFTAQFKDNQGRIMEVYIVNNQLTATQGNMTVVFDYKQDLKGGEIDGIQYTNATYGDFFIDRLGRYIIFFDTIFYVIPQNYGAPSGGDQNNSYQQPKKLCTHCNGSGVRCVLKSVPTYGTNSNVKKRCPHCSELLSYGSVHIQQKCVFCNGTGYK